MRLNFKKEVNMNQEYEHKKLSIDTIDNGAIIELVDHEAKKVINNILDPNTIGKGQRQIIVSIKFNPSENRETVTIDYQVTSKLQPCRPNTVLAMVGRDEQNEAVAFVNVAKEQQLFDDNIIEAGKKEAK
jgi:hypothetical protein